MPRVRDFWDRAEIVGKLLLPLVVAGIGYLISRTLNEVKDSEQDTRVYTELMTTFRCAAACSSRS